MKKLFIILFFILIPIIAEAKCVNSSSYVLKGYFEDSNNNPVTGKTLSEILFDIFYDDATSSLSNVATAEMGQGWYRYTYTANAKNGIWVMRDSTSTYKNFPGGILEQLCDSQVSNYDGSGNVAIQDGTGAGQLDTSSGKVSLAPIATGTENAAQTSTATRVYTAISDGTRRYIGMCLENTANNQRAKITGYGTSPANYFDVRGFSASVGDSVTLNVWPEGCD